MRGRIQEIGGERVPTCGVRLPALAGPPPRIRPHRPGSELRSPVAISVVGGLITATALTLAVVPVLYTLLDRFTPRGREERRLAGAGPVEVDPVNT